MTLSLWMALALLAPPDADLVRETLPAPVPEMIADYQAWDAHFRGGIGYSDRVTSGGLGWAEARFLRDYVHAWNATADPYWLDRVIDHVDRILASQHDRDGDGFLAWDDADYSVAFAQVTGAENAGELTLAPEAQKEMNGRRAATVSGHRYAIELPAVDRVRVVDLDSGDEVLAPTPYDGTLVLDLFGPGAHATAAAAKQAGVVLPLVLSGPGRAGARFVVETTAPEAIEYQVHDGMVAYPIAQFIEAVYTHPELPARYREAADRYLAWFDRHVYQKWEPTWEQVDAEAGLYRFTDDPTQRYPGYSLPHNQYLALGRAYLVLQAIEGAPNRAAYRDKAAAMATFFKRHLRPALDGAAYEWNYWDPLPGEEIRRNVEDVGHGTLDVGFAAEAAQRGIVFTDEDMERFAKTYVARVAGVDDPATADLEAVRTAFRVDGSGKREARVWFDYALAGLYDADAWRVGAAFAGTRAPQIADLAGQLGAVGAADRAQARAATERLLADLEALRAGNLGFELGRGSIAFGWEQSVWSAEAGEGHFEWSADAHEGERSLALVGTAGSPNLVAGHALELEGETPAPLTIRVWYKTAGAPKPYLSLIAPVPGGERQYDNSPALPPSETWREAEWTITPRAGATSATIYLRNSGVGTVWYDDVRIER